MSSTIGVQAFCVIALSCQCPRASCVKADITRNVAIPNAAISVNAANIKGMSSLKPASIKSAPAAIAF